MKIRQAKKILRRHYRIELSYDPLPRCWRRYRCLWHKAIAVDNHHCGPLGRMNNRWMNDNASRYIKWLKS